MLKLIKWDCIDFFRKNYWMFLGFLVVLAMAVIPSSGSDILSALMIASSSGLGAILFVFCVALAAIQCIDWLRRDTVLLELSLPLSPVKLMVSRLVMAVLSNTFACLFILQLMLAYAKYSTGSISSFSPEKLSGIPILVLILTTIDMTILFSYLISKSLSNLRGVIVILTGVLCVILFGAILTLSIWIMTLTGAILLPFVSTDAILTLEGNLQVLSMVVPVMICIITIALELAGSNALLKYGFQEE